MISTATVDADLNSTVPVPVHDARVELSAISKRFGPATVLHNVALTVQPGQIHALLGQNGSGKSTLIKVLSGVHRPEPGAAISVDGRPVQFPVTPQAISRRGLTFVHQSLGLLPGLSVAENIRLAQLKRRGTTQLINWRYERDRAAQTLSALHADIDPRRTVDDLHIGQRATVAIARALQTIVPGQGCVVLDESTQSLPREVLPDFYDTLRRLAAAGTSILIVSHRLDEVLTIADTATVLRDGRVSASAIPTRDLSEADLAKVILGRELSGWTPRTLASQRPAPSDAPLRLAGVSGRMLTGIDLEIGAHEIVGITGATDAGHDELPYLLAGANSRMAQGTITLRSEPINVAQLTVQDCIAAGIVLVPGDRARDGIALGLSAQDNVTVPRITPGMRILRRGWQRREFDRACRTLGIVPADPHLRAESFSGGNQQKLLLAKWLLHRPEVLVLHEPTQAVDVGARADILHAIQAAADAGARVLISSIEAQDLALVCDRVLVLRAGRIAKELHAPMTADDILQAE